jgi:phosphatidylglycerol:prolipoprotein diacylglycerol transferase
MDAAFPLIDFNPVAISIGPLAVHWYGIMYLLAFLAFWWIGGLVARKRGWWGWKTEDVSDVLFYGMLGVILGGRLGYVVFYGFESLLSDPLFAFRIWDGGMSFHGGLIGVIVAMAWYGRRTGRTFWQVADFVAPIVPIGLALGRIGNFIGGELWGRISDVPWAMVFAKSIAPSVTGGATVEEAWRTGALDHLARHPSQLYQAGLEGLALFIILMWYSASRRPSGAISGLFLTGYGLFRLIVEFFREPDAHLGFLAGDWLTMGMLLTLPMIAAGTIIMIIAYRKQPATESRAPARQD